MTRTVAVAPRMWTTIAPGMEVWHNAPYALTLAPELFPGKGRWRLDWDQLTHAWRYDNPDDGFPTKPEADWHWPTRTFWVGATVGWATTMAAMFFDGPVWYRVSLVVGAVVLGLSECVRRR